FYLFTLSLHDALPILKQVSNSLRAHKKHFVQTLFSYMLQSLGQLSFFFFFRSSITPSSTVTILRFLMHESSVYCRLHSLCAWLSYYNFWIKSQIQLRNLSHSELVIHLEICIHQTKRHQIICSIICKHHIIFLDWCNRFYKSVYI